MTRSYVAFGVPRALGETDRFYFIQTRLVAFVQAYRRRYVYPPSLREMAASFDTHRPATSTIYKALKVLRAKGILTWESGKTRTVHLLYT